MMFSKIKYLEEQRLSDNADVASLADNILSYKDMYDMIKSLDDCSKAYDLSNRKVVVDKLLKITSYKTYNNYSAELREFAKELLEDIVRGEIDDTII